MLRPATHDSSRQGLSRFSHTGFSTTLGQDPHAGKLSVREDAHHLMISFDFSQFDEKSLDIWVEDHQLTLTADQRPQLFSKGTKPVSLFSCIELTGDVDEDSIQVELKNALLEICFKKDRENASTAF